MRSLFLALLLPEIAYAAPDANLVHRALEEGDRVKAEKRCARWQATEPSTALEVREACARVAWAPTEAIDTPAAWEAYRKTWAGTKGERPALEREARLALAALGDHAAEDALVTIAKKYADTPASDVALNRAALVAAGAVSTPEEAAQVVTRYGRDARVVAALMEHYPTAFAEYTVDSATQRVTAKLKGGVQTSLPLTATWAVRRTGGEVVPWDSFAADALSAQGVPRESLDAALAKGGGRAFPLCSTWEVPALKAGISLQLGTGTQFDEQPWGPSCGDDAAPAFITMQHGAVTGLSLQPGHWMTFPHALAVTGFTWSGQGAGATDLYIPFTPGEPVVVGGAQVVGQQFGALYLVHPVGGGMPWMTNMAPPTSATPIRSTLKSEAMPRGWTLTPLADAARVDGPGAVAWILPPGEVRLLSPLYQWMTQLSRANPKLTGQFPPPLPALYDLDFWKSDRAGVTAAPPPGTSLIPLGNPDAIEISGALSLLSEAGIPVRVKRAVRLNLDEDNRDEFALEVERGGIAMRAVVDVYASGAKRVFLFDALPEPAFDATAGTPFAFRREGQAFLAWTGVNAGVAFLEAIHLDERGLIREMLTK